MGSLQNLFQLFRLDFLVCVAAYGAVLFCKIDIWYHEPPKTSYSLTSLGQSLIPVPDAMCEWGNTYLEELKRSHHTQLPGVMASNEILAF